MDGRLLYVFAGRGDASFVPGKSSIKRRAVRDAQGRLLYYVYNERLQEKTVLAYRINGKRS